MAGIPQPDLQWKRRVKVLQTPFSREKRELKRRGTIDGLHVYLWSAEEHLRTDGTLGNEKKRFASSTERSISSGAQMGARIEVGEITPLENAGGGREAKRGGKENGPRDP